MVLCKKKGCYTILYNTVYGDIVQNIAHNICILKFYTHVNLLHITMLFTSVNGAILK